MEELPTSGNNCHAANRESSSTSRKQVCEELRALGLREALFLPLHCSV